MRTPKTLKFTSLLLTMLIIMQSCSVYSKTKISKQQAFESEVPLKIKLEGKNYKVIELISKQEKTFVRVKRHAKLVKDYKSRYVSTDGKTAIFDITDLKIASYHEKNKTASTLYSILAIVSGTGLIVLIAFLISSSNKTTPQRDRPILIL